VNGTTTTYATTDINPTGYSQVVGESYSPRVNGTESQHSYIYGLDAALELRSHYDGVGNNLTQQMYFVHDGHGSVRAITDQNGAVADTYDRTVRRSKEWCSAWCRFAGTERRRQAQDSKRVCVSCSPCRSPMVFTFVRVRRSIPLPHFIDPRSSRIPARANSHAGARRCRRFGQSV
jgi:hypothetical protein